MIVYKMDIQKLTIKKEIGRRFKRFREALGKTQSQLAVELGIYQSTITNIEVGKTFPSIKYLHYFHRKYRLNTNWLLSDEGDIFLVENEPASAAIAGLDYHLQRSDAISERYAELLELMQLPVVEQIMMAKLLEIKVIARDEIEHFRNTRKKVMKSEPSNLNR